MPAPRFSIRVPAPMAFAVVGGVRVVGGDSPRSSARRSRPTSWPRGSPRPRPRPGRPRLPSGWDPISEWQIRIHEIDRWLTSFNRAITETKTQRAGHEVDGADSDRDLRMLTARSGLLRQPGGFEGLVAGPVARSSRRSSRCALSSAHSRGPQSRSRSPDLAPIRGGRRTLLPVPPQCLDLEAVSSLLKRLEPAFAAPQGSIPTEQEGAVLLVGIASTAGSSVSSHVSRSFVERSMALGRPRGFRPPTSPTPTARRLGGLLRGRGVLDRHHLPVFELVELAEHLIDRDAPTVPRWRPTGNTRIP